jgi:hypothetical protein
MKMANPVDFSQRQFDGFLDPETKVLKEKSGYVVDL